MKLKWMLVVVTSVMFFTANAQFRKIPSEVTDAFREKYQSAKQVSWKDNLTNFQASFKMGNNDFRAYYNSKGDWLKTEKDFTFSALPEAVKDGYQKSKYNDWEVKEVLYIEQNDGLKEYRLLVRKSDLQKKNLYFSEQGQLLDDSITL